jgi:hypothetical protein
MERHMPLGVTRSNLPERLELAIAAARAAAAKQPETKTARFLLQGVEDLEWVRNEIATRPPRRRRGSPSSLWREMSDEMSFSFCIEEIDVIFAVLDVYRRWRKHCDWGFAGA